MDQFDYRDGLATRRTSGVMEEVEVKTSENGGAIEIAIQDAEAEASADSSESSTSEQTPSDTEESLAQKYLDHLQRLQVEFSNYRKRVEKENLELSAKVRSECIKNFLPVVDDLERLLELSRNHDGSLVRGLRLVYEKLLAILKSEGVEPFQSVGQLFDPHFHEAASVAKANNGNHGMVIEEWQKGYLFQGKLLRPARVKVAQAADE